MTENPLLCLGVWANYPCLKRHYIQKDAAQELFLAAKKGHGSAHMYFANDVSDHMVLLFLHELNTDKS